MRQPRLQSPSQPGLPDRRGQPCQGGQLDDNEHGHRQTVLGRRRDRTGRTNNRHDESDEEQPAGQGCRRRPCDGPVAPASATRRAAQSTPADHAEKADQLDRRTQTSASPSSSGLCSQVRQQSTVIERIHEQQPRRRCHDGADRPRPAVAGAPAPSGPARNTRDDQQARAAMRRNVVSASVLAVRETPTAPAISGTSQAAPTTASRTAASPAAPARRPTATQSPHPPQEPADVGRRRRSVASGERCTIGTSTSSPATPARHSATRMALMAAAPSMVTEVPAGELASASSPLDGGQAVDQTRQSPAGRQPSSADAVVVDAGPQASSGL